MNRNIFAALATALLTACGGGGGGNTEIPEERPEGTAKGIAQHGPIINADISAYDWDGGRGTLRGGTQTDREGKYSLKVSVSDRPLLIGSRDGSYSEESTGRSVQMGSDELTAVIFYESGRNVDVQLTYFTTLATCRAEYLIKEGGQTVGNAINIANNEWSAILGVDIVGVQPVDVTKSSAFTPFMTPSHQYGIALAGVSELVENIRQEEGGDESNPSFTVKYLTKVACSDIRFDGQLNGLGAPTAGNPSGQLYIGSMALTTDLYRRSLGQGVIEFGINENNQTGLQAIDFLELANGIAVNSSAVFGGTEGAPVDNEGPIVTSSLAEGSLLNSMVVLPFEVSDPLGVKTVSFYIDGEFYSEGQPTDPRLNWITTAYEDGDHTVRVVATDVLNNEDSAEFTFVVANEGPGLTVTSPTLVNSTTYTAFGEYSALISDVDRIEINGVDAVLDVVEGTWSARITLDGGVNAVDAVIYDTIGNSTSVEVTVNVDLFDPTITSFDTLATFTNFDGQLNLCESIFLNADISDSRPICLNAENVSLNGNPVRLSLQNDGYLVLGVDINDPQGANGVFSDTDKLILEYRVTLNGELLVDWSPVTRPDLTKDRVVLPVTTEYFGEDFYQVSREDSFSVVFRVTDEAGGSSSLAYDFQLDVLTPPLLFETTIVNDAVFDRSFEQRSFVNGESIILEYTYNNVSTFDYLMRINMSDAHDVVQSFETVVLETQQRIVEEQQWRWEKTYYDLATGNINRTGIFESLDELWVADNPDRWGYVDGLSRIVPEMNPGEWEITRNNLELPTPSNWRSLSISECPAPRISVDIAGAVTTAWIARSGNVINPDNIVCGLLYNALQERTGYRLETAAGFPRGVLSSDVLHHSIASESVRVINKTQGIEIFPSESGVYEIPSQSDILIRRTLVLPTFVNYDDEGVVNTDLLDLGETAYLDNVISWMIDTEVEILRAIKPVGADDNTVSFTSSIIGNGEVSYSLTRS